MAVRVRVWVVALVLALAAWCGPAVAQDGKPVRDLTEDKELRELGSKARQLFKDGKGKEAMDVALAGLAIAEGRYGPDHAIVAQAHWALAYLYTLQDQPEDAEPHQQRAMALFERPLAALTPEELKKAPDPPRPYGFSPAAGMAMLYYFQGASYYIEFNRCTPAIPLLERSLVWLENGIGPDAYGPTEMGDRLVRCLIEGGRYVDAERFLKHAIAIGERMPDDANGGRRRDFRPMLASLYAAQGRSEAAKALLKDVGPFPPGAVEKVFASASEIVQTGRYAEAEALYKQELARLEDYASFAPTRAAIDALQDKLNAISGYSAEANTARHPLHMELGRLQRTLPTAEKIAAVRHTLGALYQKQGRYAEAEALFREELARLERAAEFAGESWRLQQTLPTDQIARVLHALGQLYHEQGKHAEAEALLKRAIGLHEHLDYADQISIEFSLARLHTDQQHYGDAESAYKQVLSLYAKRDRHERGKLATAPTASVLKSIAALPLKQGHPDRAEELHKRALKVLKDLGPDRFDVAGMLNDLAELYRGQKRFAEAEPLYKRALAICVKGDMSPITSLSEQCSRTSRRSTGTRAATTMPSG
jgi:tetratricopeptide (TPR) repeat protein